MWMRDVKNLATEAAARTQRVHVWREVEAVALMAAWAIAGFVAGVLVTTWTT